MRSIRQDKADGAVISAVHSVLTMVVKVAELLHQGPYAIARDGMEVIAGWYPLGKAADGRLLPGAVLKFSIGINAKGDHALGIGNFLARDLPAELRAMVDKAMSDAFDYMKVQELAQRGFEE